MAASVEGGSGSKQVKHRRRVGTARPSHLMFTGGVGALIDLPNFSVLVQGIDEWRYDGLPEGAEPIVEERLLRAVQQVLGNKNVKELRPAPWLEDDDKNDNSPAKRIGVPVKPFPQWLRCTGCDQLSPLESGVWGFENFQARRPDKARFYHKSCKKLKNRKPLAVAARFLLSCTNGHLDDFPYAYFVHRGTPCPNAQYPTLYMEDHGGNQGANVTIRCGSCDARHNIRAATGQRGAENLPRCRGRHPHLGVFEPDGCEVEPQVLVLGASNQWFSQTLDAFSVPEAGASALATLVAKLWSGLEEATLPEILKYAISNVGPLKPLADFPFEAVADAVEQHRKTLAGGAPAAPDTIPDLRRPEWEIFTADPAPAPSEDFAVRRDGVPEKLRPLFSDVVHVERLREVRALIGFTRLDAPDPDDPNAVQRVRISRDAPAWVPASEVRGEGIFLRVDEPLLQAWEADIESSGDLAAHFAAYKRYRTNRNSGRIEGTFDPARGWPGPRYIALHTLSHLLIRTIALECGYSSASLGERVYAGSGPDDPWGGILIYTAVPDAEGTLGGLVSLAEAEPLERIVRRALADARRCSSDPLCAERVPKGSDDFLHGAACHVCLFVSETTCERGNKFLDRRFVVPVGGSKISLLTEDL